MDSGEWNHHRQTQEKGTPEWLDTVRVRQKRAYEKLMEVDERAVSCFMPMDT
jgi:hypothetical protein